MPPLVLVLLVVPALLVGGSSPPPPGMKTRPSTWWEAGGSKSELQQTGLQGQETLMQPMKLDREQGDSPAQKDSYGEKSLIYLPEL